MSLFIGPSVVEYNEGNRPWTVRREAIDGVSLVPPIGGSNSALRVTLRSGATFETAHQKDANAWYRRLVLALVDPEDCP